ncbi:hypothetical protein [Leifsonia shinshuensis]|uniref:hypothetical protein n=1 Tax=Leifsonia shinshuensis TaxID=150026 RepID=UPI00285B1509|nr:hypothetical protein [Leifsonia shinshuensis]MDR6970935.1 hypothetical protein [Leifsonia shinshuensis]
MSDFQARTFRAVLLRDDGQVPRVLTLPTEVDVPPNRIRVPADFAGASAFEVFELADERRWPEEATYRLVSTIPRSTEDVSDPRGSSWDLDDSDGSRA